MTHASSEAREALRQRILSIVGGTQITQFDEALTHPSYANETRTRDNQRLEFLGDSVLGLCVSEILIDTFTQADEGLLTRMRAALVNADALARWGKEIDIGSCLALGRGAHAGGEQARINVLADTVEAIVAAVYHDRGLEGARALVREIVREPMSSGELLAARDPKSALQEDVQARGLPTPIYRIVEVRGPQHDATFVVDVVIGETVLARGEGRSKRLAERLAAEAALELLPSAEFA